MLYKNVHSLAFTVSLHVWFYNEASDLTTLFKSTSLLLTITKQ